MDSKNVDESKVRFKISPVYEKDKSFNGTDDLMRLVALSEKNIGNRLLTVEETVQLGLGIQLENIDASLSYRSDR